ncbi:hypothetical protein LAJ19_21145 (plasmid) [Deinococcus taeanensis]|uniref:hypothetical protein n=1 Tax=Deinococcus taeanensis TaxID=2737050 RepID=UPI001CDCBA95|nr:hypothetical protein [Deinococcus taeanensis]UBV45301.1 hypothetical protein LAJ19_21145 [Deinococcus taeanensis]
MTGPTDDPRAELLRDAAEHTAFNSARRHVGAAGFLQRDVLEQIISAGREQISVTRSLRQIVASTQAQLQALSGMGALDEQAHVETLRGIVTSSQAQIRTATALRDAIQRTLTDVQGTPLEEISANLLNTLGAVVQRQLAQLQDLITTALGEADSVEQVAELQQVRSDAQARQVQLEHEQSERELVQLETLGAEALARVRDLEEGGLTHAAQRAALEDQADRARLRIAALEHGEEEHRDQLASLEREAQATTQRQKDLEAQMELTQTQPLGTPQD